jgi:hypothetical protein
VEPKSTEPEQTFELLAQLTTARAEAARPLETTGEAVPPTAAAALTAERLRPDGSTFGRGA